MNWKKPLRGKNGEPARCLIFKKYISKQVRRIKKFT